LDAPVVIDDEDKEQSWRPKDNEGNFQGPVRLREALVHSRNLVSVRVMRDIGGDYVRNYVTRFGFDKSQLPADLTLALGTAELSPLQVAVGYATFANGGYKVNSYYIERIEDAGGKVLQQAEPLLACTECIRPIDPPAARPAGGVTRAALLDEAGHDGKTMIPPKNLAPQVIRPQVAYLLADMMSDVIKRGTGVRARALGRDDVGGKTGTTNDHHDAWFTGFNGDLVTSVWVGFDDFGSLGKGEFGAKAALPIWMSYTGAVLKDQPASILPLPPGITTVQIDRQSGLPAGADDPNIMSEIFKVEDVDRLRNQANQQQEDQDQQHAYDIF
jgi:penicillin-binding protein 1A